MLQKKTTEDGRALLKLALAISLAVEKHERLLRDARFPTSFQKRRQSMKLEIGVGRPEERKVSVELLVIIGILPGRRCQDTARLGRRTSFPAASEIDPFRSFVIRL